MTTNSLVRIIKTFDISNTSTIVSLLDPDTDSIGMSQREDGHILLWVKHPPEIEWAELRYYRAVFKDDNEEIVENTVIAGVSPDGHLVCLEPI